MKKQTLTLAIFALLAVASLAVVRAAQRPNLVFILTDDQAPWALGLAGHPHAETENLDQLFRQGAYLVNAFTTTPVCSPSRAGLMTSRYGTELGITDWIHPGREPELGLDPATITWPELLQQAGYNTALFGKWHLGVPERFHPNRTGFDHFVGFRAGGTVLTNPKLDVNGTKKTFEGFTTNILTDQAIDFLQNGRDKQKPFLLCVHYRAPHAPWLPLRRKTGNPLSRLIPRSRIPTTRSLTRNESNESHGNTWGA